MPTSIPAPRSHDDARPIIDDHRPPVVLPDEFHAYVEILRCSDPAAYDLLARELAAAEDGPAAAEVAAHLRRAQMLTSLAAALESGAGAAVPASSGDSEPAAGA